VSVLQNLQVPDEHDRVAHRDPEHGHQAERRAERQVSAAGSNDHEATDDRHRQREEHQRREPPARERGLQEQIDRNRGSERQRQECGQRRVLVRGGRDDLGVVVEREVHRAQAVAHVGPHRGDVPARDARPHVDVA
jgi:hypothetical protein